MQAAQAEEVLKPTPRQKPRAGWVGLISGGLCTLMDMVTLGRAC